MSGYSLEPPLSACPERLSIVLQAYSVWPIQPALDRTIFCIVLTAAGS